MTAFTQSFPLWWGYGVLISPPTTVENLHDLQTTTMMMMMMVHLYSLDSNWKNKNILLVTAMRWTTTIYNTIRKLYFFPSIPFNVSGVHFRYILSSSSSVDINIYMSCVATPTSRHTWKFLPRSSISSFKWRKRLPYNVRVFFSKEQPRSAKASWLYLYRVSTLSGIRFSLPLSFDVLFRW